MIEILLREVTDDDVEIFYEQQLDPDATAMAAFTARGHDAHVAHWHKIRDDPTVVTRTIVASGQVAGNLVCWTQDGQREIGYWIGREHWGKGIATAALRLFLDLVPDRPLHAWVAAHNVASIRVLEKCGFERSRRQPQPEPDATRYVVMELG